MSDIELKMFFKKSIALGLQSSIKLNKEQEPSTSVLDPELQLKYQRAEESIKQLKDEQFNLEFQNLMLAQDKEKLAGENKELKEQLAAVRQDPDKLLASQKTKKELIQSEQQNISLNAGEIEVEEGILF